MFRAQSATKYYTRAKNLQAILHARYESKIFFKFDQISPDTNIKQKNTSNTFFCEEIGPLILPPPHPTRKNAHQAKTRWYHRPFHLIYQYQMFKKAEQYKHMDCIMYIEKKVCH